MSFLDNTGLAYFYSKLKEKFIQTVNGEVVDSHGNVQINQVPLAENLTSPDAQASIDTFTYRTSGGSASLDSGEANLVFVNGNMTITGRVSESWSATASTGLSCNVNNIDEATWRIQVSSSGNTTFTYTTAIADEAVTSWNSTASWSPSLATYGLSTAISGVVNYSINCVTSGTGISAATINPTTFSNSSLGSVSSTQIFTYFEAEEDDPSTEDADESREAGWYINDNLVTLANYGIVATGTPVEGDTITITWTIGTASNSTVIITYVAPVQGTLNIAKPTAFQSTGFNQFDKDTMVLSGASINRTTGKVIENVGTYLCYCPSKGGDHGYAVVSLTNQLNTTGGMGWCATIPVVGSDVVVTSDNITDSISTYSGKFTYSEDGYTLVVVDNPDDIMMGCAWSDYITDIDETKEYVAYVSPSQIPIPMQGYDSQGQRAQLPTASYGLPRLGSVYDTINFDASTYIQRIGQMNFSDSNLITVQNYYNTYGTPYDYDSTNIFYVLDGNAGNDPITYNLETIGSYTATSGAVTAVDFDKFIANALPAIIAYDSIMHDAYTFTATDTTNVWSYTWNDGISHSQSFTFESNWGVSFGSVSSGNTMTLYLPITSIYQVDDHGTEKFIGTTIPVEAELLYGQNLRDKLRTDVLTISEQSLTNTQQKQIHENINAGALVFTNISIVPTDSTITISVDGSSTVTVDKTTFETQITTTGTYVFSYSGTDWSLNETTVNLTDYGITTDGTDTITIDYTAVISAFSADNTYSDYGYKCNIATPGVLDNMIPQVIFDVSDATSGTFAPVASSGTNIVTIWSNAAIVDTITIPTIICWRANS